MGRLGKERKRREDERKIGGREDGNRTEDWEGRRKRRERREG